MSGKEIIHYIEENNLYHVDFELKFDPLGNCDYIGEEVDVICLNTGEIVSNGICKSETEETYKLKIKKDKLTFDIYFNKRTFKIQKSERTEG